MFATAPESASTKTISPAQATIESKSAGGGGEQVAGLSSGGQSSPLQKETTYNLALQSANRAESAQEQRGEGKAAEQSVSALATQKDKKGSMMTTAAKHTAAPSPFSHTLSQAQLTADLKEREKIWRHFLATAPDSASRDLAIYHLAQTLTAASDSSSTAAALEQNLTFFRENSHTLRPQMGATEFERELARLQDLVKWRQASAVEKP
jgi:hypothetical protein